MNTEQTQTTEQQTQARQRIEARRMAMAARISGIGRAENQSVSPEVLELAHEEIARLQKQNENQEQTIRVQAETIARLEGRDINRLMETKEPPLPPETANVPDTQKWAGGWKNLHGWKVPDDNGLHIRINGEVLQWRNSIGSGWVPAEEWGEPVAVHTAPNVRRAGGR